MLLPALPVVRIPAHVRERKDMLEHHQELSGQALPAHFPPDEESGEGHYQEEEKQEACPSLFSPLHPADLSSKPITLPTKTDRFRGQSAGVLSKMATHCRTTIRSGGRRRGDSRRGPGNSRPAGHCKGRRGSRRHCDGLSGRPSRAPARPEGTPCPVRRS